MDEKVKKTRAAKKPEKEEKESVLIAAAKAIGSAAGTVASAVGIHETAPAGKPKRQKLAARNKSRLPRRQKKSLKKAEAKGRRQV